MLAGNAKRIFCDNVTCFGTNESCWNRSHLPEFFIKAPHFLLAWLLCFFTQTPRFYIFLGGDLCNTHDCPGQNNSHFSLENEGEKCHLSFGYGNLLLFNTLPLNIPEYPVILSQKSSIHAATLIWSYVWKRCRELLWATLPPSQIFKLKSLEGDSRR